MKTPKWTDLFILFLIVTSTVMSSSHAQSVPTSFVYQGQITKTGGVPLEANPVIFNVRIYSPTNDCLLYEEQHSINMLGSEGMFSLNVGGGIRSGSDYEDTSSIVDIFKNGVSFSGITSCSSGTSYNALTGHTRKVRISYNDGGGLVTLAQDFHLQTVPYAWYANSLQGLTPSNFVQVNAGQNVTQSNLENLLGGTNYNTLYNLASGTSTTPISMNNQQIKNLADPTLPQDAATKNYTDTRIAGSLVNLGGVGAGMGDGRVLAWNATLNQWEAITPSAITDSTKLPLAGGTMGGNINMNGNQILNTGHITMQSLATVTLGKFTSAEETILAGTLTVANRGAMWFNSTDSALKYWDGSAVVDVQGGGGTITGVTAGTGLTGGGTTGSVAIDIATGGITTTLLADNSVTTNKIIDGTIITADIADGAITNVKIDSVNVSKIVNGPGDYFAYMPAGSACADGDVLKWDNSNNRWICGSDNNSGDITAVNTSGPITGGATSGAVSLGLNYDTNTLNVNGANELEVRAAGISATQLAANAVTTAKILDANVTTPKIADDAVTTAKILDLNVTNAKISSVGVEKITSSVGQWLTYLPNGAACANGEVLKWDNSNSRWICGTDITATGDIEGISTSAPLSGGAASGTVSLALNYDNTTIGLNGSNALAVRDAGIGANKLAADAVTSSKIQDGSIVNADINAAAAIAWSKIDKTGASASDVGAVPTTRSVNTNVGSGLTGGGDLSADRNLAVNTDNSTLEVATNTLRIRDAGVTGVKLAADSVTSAKIVDGTVATADIGNSQVTDDKIDTVSVSKITSALGQYLTYNPNGGACAIGEVLKRTVNGWECGTDSSGVSAHSALTGLSADDHTQYVMLAGRSGGQNLRGGTAASNNLTLESTSDATKGFVLLQPNGGNVGIGTSSPVNRLEIQPSLNNDGVNVLRLGAGNANGAAWGYKVQNSTVSDVLHLGFSSSNYSTGGSAPWIGDANAFLYFPIGSDFRIGSNVGSTPFVTVNSTGNVGIGTANPTNGKLEVVGTAYASGGFVLPDDGFLYWRSGDGSTGIRGNSTSDILSIQTTGVERLRVDSTGNVG
ncbi:MAG: hypothetical protein K2Q26_04230, partial [Bdellovibrionales bacterium]|nr:hypothetical protein [Bdellovibrionales bacterium]